MKLGEIMYKEAQEKAEKEKAKNEKSGPKGKSDKKPVNLLSKKMRRLLMLILKMSPKRKALTKIMKNRPKS